jgi:putative hydrolase of HD superfamily
MVDQKAEGMRTLVDRLGIAEKQCQQLDFLLDAHALTAVHRLNRLLDGTRSENSAEHSWHLAVTAMVLAPDFAPNVDLTRVISMLLIHDLPEVEVGDVPIYDEKARANIIEAERAAASRFFGQLPNEQGKDLLDLWSEFEAAETEEACFAKAIDRLQPLMLHWAGDGSAWAERRVTVSQERRLMAVIEKYWPPLGPIVAKFISDAHDRGMLVNQ